jgi:arylsulfatase A-like enzyme
MKQFFSVVLVLTALTGIFNGCKEKPSTKTITLLVIFDGLRPEYITPEIMPNTYKLKMEGALASEHRSVFPTLTRVNSAAIASGAYPATNGIMGNSVFFPSIDSSRALNSGDASELMRVTNHPDEQLFTSPTLAEILKKNGKNFMVFSTGSTGQSFLLNHLAADFGAILNPQLILPESLTEELVQKFGPIPSADKKNMLRHTWITDAWLHYGLADDAPEVSFVWFSDPDATAHSYGVGAPETLSSIQYVDKELGRIMAGIVEKGMKDQVNILIGTDHGFVTHIGTNSVTSFLLENDFKESADSDDVVIAGGAIYVKDKAKVSEMARALMQQDWIGGVFTSASDKDSTFGVVEGTLSMKMVKFDHEQRSPDILVDMMWNNESNAFGYPGTSFSRGIAGHGGSSPYEMYINLIGSGPDFKSGYVSSRASGNVDIVPTILFLQNLEIPKEMDGRVLSELMINHEDSIAKSAGLSFNIPGGFRNQEIKVLRTGDYWYLSSIHIKEQDLKEME